MTNLDDMALEVHATAREKGFWPVYGAVDIEVVLSKIALCHSELSETLEAVRKQQGEHKVVEELADTIIRILDLYAGMRNSLWVTSSLQDVFDEKTKVNKDRPQMHGNLA